jgi:hypothetical protein
MLLIVNKRILRNRFVGVTLWPFIVMKHAGLKSDPIFINHERIHLKQQLEMLVLPFFVWYGIEYLFRLVQYRNRYDAYRNISFEREAYQKEADLDYLQGKKLWSFLKFL